MESDLSTYLRLARQATTRPERDYFVECAKSVLRKNGVDISWVHEDPNIALEELEKGRIGYAATGKDVYGPYAYLFEQIEPLL